MGAETKVQNGNKIETANNYQDLEMPVAPDDFHQSPRTNRRPSPTKNGSTKTKSSDQTEKPKAEQPAAPAAAPATPVKAEPQFNLSNTHEGIDPKVLAALNASSDAIKQAPLKRIVNLGGEPAIEVVAIEGGFGYRKSGEQLFSNVKTGKNFILSSDEEVSKRTVTQVQTVQGPEGKTLVSNDGKIFFSPEKLNGAQGYVKSGEQFVQVDIAKAGDATVVRKVGSDGFWSSLDGKSKFVSQGNDLIPVKEISLANATEGGKQGKLTSTSYAEKQASKDEKWIPFKSVSPTLFMTKDAKGQVAIYTSGGQQVMPDNKGNYNWSQVGVGSDNRAAAVFSLSAKVEKDENLTVAVRPDLDKTAELTQPRSGDGAAAIFTDLITKGSTEVALQAVKRLPGVSKLFGGIEFKTTINLAQQ